MVQRVKRWLREGKTVKIFTARVSGDNGVARRAIQKFCQKAFGQVLPITNRKDQYCKQIWDDRAHNMKANTGEQMNKAAFIRGYKEARPRMTNKLEGDNGTEHEVSFVCKSGDGTHSLVNMLEQIRRQAAPGHSFSIVVDPDVKSEAESFGFDGDGSDHIEPNSIKVDGKTCKFEEEKEAVNTEAFLQGYRCKLARQALTVSDKPPLHHRPVSGTIGRAMALPTLMVGTAAPLRRTASLSDKEIKDIVRQGMKSKELKNIYLDLGRVRPLEQIKRIARNPRMSAPIRMLAMLLSPLDSMKASLTRSDHYNPASETVTLFHKDPAILQHELGHARDFSKMRHPGLYMLARTVPGVPLIQEARASRFGTKAEVKRTEKEDLKDRLKKLRRTNRILGGAFGTYVGALMYGLSKKYLPEEYRHLAYEEVRPGMSSSEKQRAMLSNMAKLTLFIASPAFLGQAAGAAFLPFGGRAERAKLKELEKKKRQP
jgi:hypothetical protein